VLQDGFDGISGLTGAGAILVSPDGARVFVAASTSDAVVVFERDVESGELTWLQTINNGAILTAGTDPVRGIGGAADLALAPDGRHLYVTGFEDDAVAQFFSQPDGTLGFLGAVQQSDQDFIDMDGDGLLGARGIALSSDGANVYVAGSINQAIAVFTRDPGTGLLTFLDVTFNVPGITMSQPWDVIGNPDLSLRNFTYMREEGLKPVPVLHYGTDPVELEGMVTRSAPSLASAR